jgi:hypothetical protein
MNSSLIQFGWVDRFIAFFLPKIIFIYENNKSEMKIEDIISLDTILLKYLSMIEQKKEDILFLNKGKMMFVI